MYSKSQSQLLLLPINISTSRAPRSSRPTSIRAPRQNQTFCYRWSFRVYLLFPQYWLRIANNRSRREILFEGLPMCLCFCIDYTYNEKGSHLSLVVLLNGMGSMNFMLVVVEAWGRVKKSTVHEALRPPCRPWRWLWRHPTPDCNKLGLLNKPLTLGTRPCTVNIPTVCARAKVPCARDQRFSWSKVNASSKTVN